MACQDLAHTAFPEQGGDVVVPEAGADGQGHELCARMIGTFYARTVRGSTVPAQKCPSTAYVRIV